MRIRGRGELGRDEVWSGAAWPREIRRMVDEIGWNEVETGPC